MNDPVKTSSDDEFAKKDDFYKNLDKISPLVAGYSWSIRISTYCFEFVALLLLGRFVDVRYGWKPWGLIVGALIGAYVFITGLISVVKRLEQQNSQNDAK